MRYLSTVKQTVPRSSVRQVRNYIAGHNLANQVCIVCTYRKAGKYYAYISVLFLSSFTPEKKPAWLNRILETPLSWGRGDRE